MSKNAARECTAFAAKIGAKITGIHVMPEISLYAYEAEMLEDVRAKFSDECVASANLYLAEIAAVAKEAGVTCDTYYVASDYPYEAIIQAAQDKVCDLIAMASHGRRGVKGLLLGSVTQKVLTHSRIPVLVYRST